MDLNQVKQTIGQLEASIDKVEPFLDKEEFTEYCDSIYTAITHWRMVIKMFNSDTKSGKDE